MTESWLEYHAEPVQLHSGGWSHWLVRGDLIFEDEELRKAVIDKWRQALPYEDWDIVAIANGGTVWAEALRRDLRPDEVFVVEKHDLARAALFASTEERALVVVDDVATTGSSLICAVPRADVRLCVVDRSMAGLKSATAWAHIPLPLCEAPR